MEVRIENRNAQLVCRIVDGDEPIGYVAIDTTVDGHACGGVRLLPDVEEGELRLLARSMTLKYGFLGLPQGGAKAGILGDPESPSPERNRRIERFAEAVAPLLRSRTFVPAADMGMDDADVRRMLEVAGVKPGARGLRDVDSGYYTALTVFAGARCAARRLALPLSGLKTAIEGFGKVGSMLARLLAAAGSRIVAISTSRGAIYNPAGLDVERLVTLAARKGGDPVEGYREAQRLPREALLELPVDLLSPCARHHSLRADNARAIRARIVSAGANNPLTPDGERVLFQRGVIFLPDFVTNAGGVLGGTMAFASVGRRQIERFVETEFEARIVWILEEAERRTLPPSAIATSLAERRFDQVRRAAERRTSRAALFAAGLALYRRGLVPGRLVAHLSIPFFRRSLA
jgi:glutamate dehydrogenase (NAD(P)+)